MKFVRFGEVGQEKPGAVDALGKIRSLESVVRDIVPSAIESGVLARINYADLEGLPIIPGNTRLGSPIGQVGKVVCAGMNYSDHCLEAGFEIPKEPAIFMKATTAICGPNDDVIHPAGAEKLDWEVEIAAVIGSRTKNVTVEDALDHVFAYTILNDVSERAHQMERGGQWVKGKSADTFAPVGPWLVTADEVRDPQNLDMWLNVNGVPCQVGNTSKMIFGVAQLVSYISHFMTLMPGDILSTGTPPGVGMGQKPPRYLKVGDVMDLGVSGLGTQRQRVVAADHALLTSAA